ncbi:MAG: hypothetical protein AAFR31_03870 [Cyanobacteria bacterium J06627_8]
MLWFLRKLEHFLYVKCAIALGTVPLYSIIQLAMDILSDASVLNDV